MDTTTNVQKITRKKESYTVPNKFRYVLCWKITESECTLTLLVYVDHADHIGHLANRCATKINLKQSNVVA